MVIKGKVVRVISVGEIWDLERGDGGVVIEVYGKEMKNMVDIGNGVEMWVNMNMSIFGIEGRRGLGRSEFYRGWVVDGGRVVGEIMEDSGGMEREEVGGFRGIEGNDGG